MPDVKATVEEWLNMLIEELSPEKLERMKKALNEGTTEYLDDYRDDYLYTFIKEYESDWGELPTSLK